MSSIENKGKRGWVPYRTGPKPHYRDGVYTPPRTELWLPKKERPPSGATLVDGSEIDWDRWPKPKRSNPSMISAGEMDKALSRENDLLRESLSESRESQRLLQERLEALEERLVAVLDAGSASNTKESTADPAKK